MQDTLYVKIDKENILQEIIVDLPKYEVHIDKSQIGNSNEERLKYNILAVARKNSFVKKFVIELANNGFFLVDHNINTGISIFRSLKKHEEFIHSFRDENVLLWNKTYYTLEKPISLGTIKSNRLLVIFSSIADFPLNASISRRSFYKNWIKVQSYIPKNTYILRIVDIGGVLGSFYLNSNFDSKFESRIQLLIENISNEYSIKKNNIILFGGSKGGTGALYHGVIGGYNTVAVDPIVSDRYYIDKFNDLHFVQGGFPVDKDKKFFDLFKERYDLMNINVITSQNSQQFEYINKIITKKSNTNLFVFNNSNIKTHPDVGPQALVFSTTLINSIYYNIYNYRSFETEY